MMYLIHTRTLQGYEVMNMLRKGQVTFITRLFAVAT